MAYEAMPLLDTAERAGIMEGLIRKTCGFETAFSDFQPTCEERCFEEKPLEALCSLCSQRMHLVAIALATGLTWEIWRTDDAPELVGVVRISKIKPGEDAVGHYLFFDHDLRGKTAVLKELIQWVFTEHPGWQPLRRLTVEIPDFAFALARHASRKLGFGGPFPFVLKGSKIKVEGVKEEAILWRGQPRSLLLLGLLNPEKGL